MPLLTFIGSVLGDTMSQSSAGAANATNVQLAQQNRDWMTQMSDTAMQRRVTDLKAAGLNPLLGASQQGASQPSMASPMVSPTGGAWANLGQQTGTAVQSAAQGIAGIANTQAQTDNLAAQTNKINSQNPYSADSARLANQNLEQSTSTLRSQMYQADSQFDLNVQTTGSSMQKQQLDLEMFPLQKQYQQLEIARARAGLPSLEADANFWKGLSPQMQAIIKGGQAVVGPAASAIGAVKGTSLLPSIGFGGKIPPMQ